MTLRVIKLAALLALSGIGIFLTIKVCFLIGERYFFDKLFYRKSALFGYYHNQAYWSLPAENESPLIKRRTQDIAALVQTAQQDQPLPDLPDTLKIAVIGDSFAYGMGVKDGQQFPRVLEAQLNQLQPTKVYNFSLSGDGLLENYAKYQLAQRYAEIDFFIIATLDNDLQLDTDDKYPGQAELLTELRAVCPQPEWRYELPPTIAYEDLVKTYFAPAYTEEFANWCYAKTIADRMSGPRVIYMLMLKTPDYSADQPEKAPALTDRLKGVLESNSTVVDPYQLDTFEYRMVSQQEAHPAASTHFQYAGILKDTVIQYLSERNR